MFTENDLRMVKREVETKQRLLSGLLQWSAFLVEFRERFTLSEKKQLLSKRKDHIGALREEVDVLTKIHQQHMCTVSEVGCYATKAQITKMLLISQSSILETSIQE